MGAGEIILSTVDNDGARNGFDLILAEKILKSVNIPVVIASGAGSLNDIYEVASLNPSAIALASVLHFELLNLNDIKSFLIKKGIEVKK